jgi:hypothetical protein
VVMQKSKNRPRKGWRWNLHRTAKASATAKTFGTAWFISRLIKV